MKTNKQTSALLIDGEYGFLAATVVRCLAACKKVRINVLSSRPGATLRFSRHVDKFLTYASGSLEAEVRKAVRETGSEILLACSGKGTEFLIRHGADIPNTQLMHLPSLPAFQTANDKWSFHLAARSCDAGTPRTWPVGDFIPQPEMFPLLLKPSDQESGKGIVRLDSLQEFASYMRLLDAEPSNYIVQEFVRGGDMGCSVFCQQGHILAVTVQRPIEHQNHGFVPAANLRFCRHEGAVAEVSKVVKHLNWTGVANFDLRIRASDGKVMLLEMNPRFWASIYGSLRAGVNFVSLNCWLSEADQHEASKVRELDYFQGYKALGRWLRGSASDFGCRLFDPLPDLVRLSLRQ